MLLEKNKKVVAGSCIIFFLFLQRVCKGDHNISSPLRFHLFQELLTEATINVLTTRGVAVNIVTSRHVPPDRPRQTDPEKGRESPRDAEVCGGGESIHPHTTAAYLRLPLSGMFT